MQTLQNFLSESLVVEATQAAETIEIKNGKNFINNKTKTITLTGNESPGIRGFLLYIYYIFKELTSF